MVDPRRFRWVPSMNKCGPALAIDHRMVGYYPLAVIFFFHSTAFVPPFVPKNLCGLTLGLRRAVYIVYARAMAHPALYVQTTRPTSPTRPTPNYFWYESRPTSWEFGIKICSDSRSNLTPYIRGSLAPCVPSLVQVGLGGWAWTIGAVKPCRPPRRLFARFFKIGSRWQSSSRGKNSSAWGMSI